MNKFKIMLFIVLILIINTTFAYVTYNQYVSSKKTSKTEWIEKVESQESIDYTLNFLKNGTGIIFFDMENCPWCVVAKPVFKEAMEQIKYSGEIIYFNPYHIRKDNTKEYKEMVNILSDILNEDDNGNKRIYVPEVVFLKDGKVVGHKFKNISDYTDYKVPMTNIQKDELKNIYITFAQKTLDIECLTCD